MSVIDEVLREAIAQICRDEWPFDTHTEEELKSLVNRLTDFVKNALATRTIGQDIIKHYRTVSSTPSLLSTCPVTLPDRREATRKKEVPMSEHEKRFLRLIKKVQQTR